MYLEWHFLFSLYTYRCSVGHWLDKVSAKGKTMYLLSDWCWA